MSARRQRARIGIGRAAAIGAAAGLAGGVAMLLTRPLGERVIAPGRTGPVARSAAKGGMRRAARRRSRRGVGSAAAVAHLAYAAGVGAMYGLIHSRIRLPAVAEGALLTAIAGGAGFRGAQGVYGLTTTAVFRALAR